MRKQARDPERRPVEAVDLAAEQVTELPDREALPINLALAANVLSDGAVAAANAQQATPINQGMLSSPVSL